VRRPHPIEVESYRILRSRVDTTHLPPLTRAVVERVVHTTADTTWTGEIVADESALAAGRAALIAGAPLVVDVRMVAAGITSRDAIIALDLTDELTAEGSTRESGSAGGGADALTDELSGGGSTRRMGALFRGTGAGLAAELAGGGSTRGVGPVGGGAGVGLAGELSGGGSTRGVGPVGGGVGAAGGLADDLAGGVSALRAVGGVAGEMVAGGGSPGGELTGGRSTGSVGGELARAAGGELAGGGSTRAAAGVRVAARRWPDGAVWVVGNAPTALAALVDLARRGEVRPALVVGMPVGFVGSVAAKAALRASGLPAVSSVSERGGAAVAAATVNALLYAEVDDA
jgi:precorrin-8X/cobalt-precorrin-8 methylmutase